LKILLPKKQQNRPANGARRQADANSKIRP